MKLLHMDSSILGPCLVSRALSAEIVARQVELHPGTEIVYRDLEAGAALYLSSARGGLYSEGSPAAALENHESYLKGVLAFIGVTDITVVQAEGLRIGPAVKDADIDAANAGFAALAA